MKRFSEIETKLDYEDPRMTVSITMDRADYLKFERACLRDHEKPTDFLREIMEGYAYADQEDELEERYLKTFMSKGVDDKLIALYRMLRKLGNQVEGLKNKNTSYMNVSVDADDDAPF